MTKDFKKQAVDHGAFGQYGWGWMAGGIIVGLLVGMVMYLFTANKNNTVNSAKPDNPVSTSTADTTSLTAGAKPASNSQAVVDESPPPQEQPGFSYHAVLPQLEVDVPVALTQQPPTASQNKKGDGAGAHASADTPPPTEEKAALQPIPAGFNGFQVGSYKSQEQALALQNRLKGKGLETRIEQADVKGELWFRVRLGPAASPEMMQQWQQ
ncbi:MAG: SPOR domain-containing protein, partial [Thiothrix sp.]